MSPLRAPHRQRSSVAQPHLRRRVVLAAVAVFMVAVPLTWLAISVRNGWGPLRRLDRSVADSLHGWASDRPAAVDLLDLVAAVLSPWVFRAVILVLVLYLLFRGARRLAWWAAVTMLTGSLLGLVLKLIFARERPTFEAPVGVAPGFSFPSGHALNSTVGVLVILGVVLPALRGPGARAAAWIAAVALVLLVGFDRVALGVHYLSDVVGGWLVGIALVLATEAAFETWRRERGRTPSGLLDGVEPEASRRLR